MLVFPGVLLTTLLLSLPAHAQLTTKSYIQCVTRVGPKSVSPVKTTSAVLTVPWYAYRFVTVAPKTTVTPGAVTNTATATATSTVTVTPAPDIVTFTATTTSYNTETVTETQVSSTTLTATTTTTQSGATVVPTPAGFQPIESYISGSMKRRQSLDDLTPAAKAIEARQEAVVRVMIKNGKKTYPVPQYPQAVTCAGIVAAITTKTSTRTVKTTSTITAATPTSSVTTTTTLTETTTLAPARAITTTTETKLATISQTVTTTVTSSSSTTITVTVAVPTATSYAACVDNNLITQRNGQYINGWTFNDEVRTANANECCVLCQTRDGCAGAIFDGVFCNIRTIQGTCNPGADGQEVYFGDEPGDFGIVAIGGSCGRSIPRAN